MSQKSAGLIVYRTEQGKLEIFLVHPGGPYWQNKDKHAWSIPKGLIGKNEDPLITAYREFAEETGLEPPESDPIKLRPCRQSGGKTVYAWAVKGNLDPAQITSNEFELEWPPNSGRRRRFPEVDAAAWFKVSVAREKLHKYWCR